MDGRRNCHSKKYYPIIGKFVSEIIKTKNEKACSQKATRLKITYTKDDSSAVEKLRPTSIAKK